MSAAAAFAALREQTNEASPAPPGLLAQRTLLGKLIRDGLPPIKYLKTPSLDAELFYEEGLLLLAGHRKQGKTMVAGTVIKDRIEAGAPVLYLDFENGKHRIARRLEDMGLDPDAIDAHLIYVSKPRVELSTLYAELRAVLCEFPGLLIVVDSWRGLVNQLGSGVARFDQNDTLHIERVFEPLRDIVTEDGATCVVLDHPTKRTTEASAYAASNSAAKEQIVDVIYWIQEEEPYSVDRNGALSIQVKHDRDGRLTREKLFYRLGGQGAGGVLKLTPASAYDVGAAKDMLQTIEAWLVENAQGDDQAKTLRDIRQAVTGTNAAIGDATRQLAQDANSPVRATNHKRNPKFYAVGTARPGI